MWEDRPMTQKKLDSAYEWMYVQSGQHTNSIHWKKKTSVYDTNKRTDLFDFSNTTFRKMCGHNLVNLSRTDTESRVNSAKRLNLLDL